MREITPQLTAELVAHCGGSAVWKAPGFEVSTFRMLVEHVARLAYANRDELLFFRGQNKDYQSRAGGTTLYPAIYRGDSLAARELRHRFELLEQASRMLVKAFKDANIEGHRELRQKRYIQWCILQHYEVLPTPLLDLTQSLRVACSFAQLRSIDSECYVYVFSLPYVTNRISINSEHDIVNVRLLSICPPAALRPYFQEGYLTGTADVTTEFDTKTELDFRNRLIAKFIIPRAKSFWGSGFDQIPGSALYPRGDTILSLCNALKVQLGDELQTGHLGEFIKEWAGLESYMLEAARQITARDVSIREAISVLAKYDRLTPEHASRLDALRKLRNAAVHQTHTINQSALLAGLNELQKLTRELLPAKLKPTAF
jgi:hypothetical protein